MLLPPAPSGKKPEWKGNHGNKFFHQISLWIGLREAVYCLLLGGWDAMLIVLTVVVGLDYLMGVLCSIYRHRLCSDIG